MRSSSGGGMFSVFAVATNITSDRSYSTSIKWSTKVEFCSGSSTSSSADEGSPRQSEPSLSTSSRRNSGLRVCRGRQERTFWLRPGTRFHDGTPVTPADVKWSYEHYRGAWG